MEQKLFTELRPLYTTSKERPNEIRIRTEAEIPPMKLI